LDFKEILSYNDLYQLVSYDKGWKKVAGSYLGSPINIIFLGLYCKGIKVEISVLWVASSTIRKSILSFNELRQCFPAEFKVLKII
jgi:hypothetical protein